MDTNKEIEPLIGQMSKREPSVLLHDIRTSIEKIQRYTAGLDEWNRHSAFAIRHSPNLRAIRGLKLARLPPSLAATLAALPSISEIPFLD